MNITTYRTDVLGLSQEAFAHKLGLASKSRVCEIEKHNRCSVAMALKIESMSGGLVNASDICADVKLVRDATSNRSTT